MKIRFAFILMATLSLVLMGCGPGQAFGPTFTPTATITSTPTLTPTATATQTVTPTPKAMAYLPVPRWMILGQPGHNVEILGEKWNYTNDRWGETYACIDYTREKAPYLFFEQCFALLQDTLTFESQLESFLKEDFETLAPKNTFSDVGQIGLLAKRLQDNSEKFIKFFELIGTEKYIILVEMNMTTDDDAPLQTIYESQAAETIDYVMQNGLEKSHILPHPTATPLSPQQQVFHSSLADRLITESGASLLYDRARLIVAPEPDTLVDGTWEAIGDRVSQKRQQVCRDFEDRTNADVRWVSFSNCVFSVKDFPFDKIADYYQQPGDMILESNHQYEDQFVVYGYGDGPKKFDAYLLHGELIYLVNLASRVLGGERLEAVFTEEVDDFIYSVLMINVQK